METLDEAAGEATTDTKELWRYIFPGDEISSSFSYFVRGERPLDSKIL
jgi:hypothetical protein